VLSDKAKSLANLDPEQFQKQLEHLKAEVQKMSDSQLDLVLDWRASHYGGRSWSWGSISIDEVGVWFRAAGLPDFLCLGSVRETASMITKLGGPLALPALKKDRRAKDNLKGIIRVASVIANERALSLIADRDETHRPAPPCRRMLWNLCDGSVRAVGLALNGAGTLNAFFGT